MSSSSSHLQNKQQKQVEMGVMIKMWPTPFGAGMLVYETWFLA